MRYQVRPFNSSFHADNASFRVKGNNIVHFLHADMNSAPAELLPARGMSAARYADAVILLFRLLNNSDYFSCSFWLVKLRDAGFVKP